MDIAQKVLLLLLPFLYLFMVVADLIILHFDNVKEQQEGRHQGDRVWSRFMLIFGIITIIIITTISVLQALDII